jgi:Ca2+-binding RTX toxin-like protein
MAAFSAQEQLMLELINRARLDPAGEAARFGIGLNQGLAAGSISATAKQPLAPNELLVDSARAHSQWMLDTDTFSHTGAGGSSPGARMAAAGYGAAGMFGWGENIAWRGTTGTASLTGFVIQEHRDLFLSPGHRLNILGASYKEIGIGALQGSFTSSGTTYDSVMTTQNFANKGAAVFVTGVVYDDTVDNDKFYSVGEGRSGVSVTVDQASDHVTATAAAGGYAVTGSTGAADVTFSGGGLAAPVTVGIAIGSINDKIDLVDSTTIQSSASVTLKDGAADLVLLGVANINGTGNGLDNHLVGNRGNNTLNGAGGNDVLTGSVGADRLIGGGGIDNFDFNGLKDSGLASTTRDIIQGFERGIDIIDLTDIDAKSGVSGNQAFTFIGFQAFHNRKGELHLVDSGANILVEGDVNGDGKADLQIMVLGLATMGAGDFIL